MSDASGRVLVMIWDGLRPDFVGPELTPNLWALAGQGVRFDRHHSVFPSETRVNSSSLGTGCYPGRHGIVGNSLFIPEVDPAGTLNTGDHEALKAIQRQRLLFAPTLSERLEGVGRRVAVVSSGSPGSAYLQNPVGNGPLINVRGVVFPDGLEGEIVDRYGAFPEATVPATGWNDYAVDVLLGEALPGDYPLMVLWLCDPDTTQHKAGLGSEGALQAIRDNDARLGRILAAAEGHGIDLLVGSDHGFSTLAEPADLPALLQEAGFDLEGLVMTSGGIWLREEDPDRVVRLARTLQDLPWMGPVFSRGGSGGWEGGIPGTLSQKAAMIDCPGRAPDLFYSTAWTEAANDYGVRGISLGKKGTATHGTCNPFDMHNVLVASGPGFKTGTVSQAPSGIVDLAPTVLSLLGLAGADACDGRVLAEALLDGPDPEAVEVRPERGSVPTASGNRVQHLEVVEVEGTRYIDRGWVE